MLRSPTSMMVRYTLWPRLKFFKSRSGTSRSRLYLRSKMFQVAPNLDQRSCQKGMYRFIELYDISPTSSGIGSYAQQRLRVFYKVGENFQGLQLLKLQQYENQDNHFGTSKMSKVLSSRNRIHMKYPRTAFLKISSWLGGLMAKVKVIFTK